MNKISILSGGLDSTILTYKLVNDFGDKNVIALSFNYGQRHSIELDMAKKTCKLLNIPHKIIDISFISNIISSVSALSDKKKIDVPTIQQVIGDPQPPTYVPYRNMLLCSMGFTFAESNNADEVYMGLQSVDEYSYWDTSTYFIENMNNVSRLNRKNIIKLVAPFVNLKKCEEIKIGIKLGVNFENTWSCYKGDYINGACGVCPTCSERIMNFNKAGIKDPIKYSIYIDWDKLLKETKD